ncbi:craniofacial development protein 2-like [Penaeus chinensis]|uniref:craniofacial development protein 2-like n=1 Tax=Penaeus chinensis TaxID=139456 RepID=UPI001FB723A1|nr:craniofacial development protein 2-like [Penaeus chinensis]
MTSARGLLPSVGGVIAPHWKSTALLKLGSPRLDVDIVALQETRLAEAASLREKDYTFYWHGKPKDERREHGVGFAVKNSLLKMIEPPTNGSERIFTMRLNTTTCPVTLISVYAPTLMASSDTKDEFYENLCATLLKVPPKDQVILLGDFNARVGSDYEAWPSCLGKLNVGKVNENGQRLLEFCTRLNLCVANSFFQTKPQNKVSWRHPRSKHWHQLDLVLVRRSNLNSIKVVRSYHSADCDTDHLLVCCKVKLSPKKIFFSKAKGKPRLNTANMQDPVLVSQFTNLFEKEYSIIESDQAEKRWQSLKSAMHSCALATFGRKKTKSSDWFETKSKILNPVIVKKRQMQCMYNKHPSRENLYKLR